MNQPLHAHPTKGQRSGSGWWAMDRRVLVTIRGLAVLIVIVFLKEAVERAQESPGAALIAAGLGVALLMCAVPIGGRGGAMRLEEVDGRAGLAIPLRPVALSIIAGLSLLGVVVMAMGIAALVMRSLVGIPAVIFGLIFLGLGGSNLLPKARHPQSLLLTPWGVRRRIGGSNDWVAWENIRDVRAHWQDLANLGPRLPMNYLTLRTGETSRHIVTDRVHAVLLDVDPAWAYETVRHYWTHPEARSELGTAASMSTATRVREDSPTIAGV